MNLSFNSIGFNTTDGLSSAYIRTNITTTGVSVVEDATGLMLSPIYTIPWNMRVSLDDLAQIIPARIEEEDDLASAYKAMAFDDYLLAEKGMPTALEEWPEWDE